VEVDIGDVLGSGSELVRVGWGCPLEAPIANIRNTLGNELLGWINYFLPISEMLTIMTFWLVAIGVYYVASVVLRWAKAIS